MRLVFVSDTHSQHRRLTQAIIAAKADVLVHCGDFSDVEWDLRTQRFVKIGDLSGISSFAEWCEMLLRKKYVGAVVVIAGNHDLRLDATFPDIASTFPSLPEQCRKMLDLPGVHYLQDEALALEGITFYGSPWTTRFYDWGFQIDSKAHDEHLWSLIPERVDVLVTHGPPFGIGDLTEDRRSTGSHGLMEAVERVKPRVHAFGHIHHGYGMAVKGPTLFLNASTCTEEYKPTNPPIVLDLR